MMSPEAFDFLLDVVRFGGFELELDALILATELQEAGLVRISPGKYEGDRAWVVATRSGKASVPE